MDKERFISLLEQYKRGHLQQPEYIEFMDAVRTHQFDEFIGSEILSELRARLKDVRWTSEREQKLWTRINEQTTGQSIQRPVRKLFPWKKIAIACAFIISGTYIYFKTTKPAAINQPVTARAVVQQDFAPGGNKAILILSNGNKIILDSAANGTVASQNGMDVIKSKNGILAYTANDQRSTTNEMASAVSYNSLATPRGGQYQLRLPDGTKAWLNAASSITYPTTFEGAERKVAITGEVYFEVVHDAKKPFRVQTADQLIEDIGTHFNVNAYTDEPGIRTTLLEGSVRISVNRQPSTVNRQPPRILEPGQQSIEANGKLEMAQNPNLDQVMAWKNGLFDFTDADLPAVMKQLGRWYNIHIKYPAIMPVFRFQGQLQRSLNLSQVLEALSDNGVDFKIENDTLTIRETK